MPHIQKNAKPKGPKGKHKTNAKHKAKGKGKNEKESEDTYSNANIYYKPFTLPMKAGSFIPSILLVGEGDLSFSAD